jgi:hypothetical protein
LRGYLQKITSDPSKGEFWEYLDKVGMMHAGLGGQHPLNVDFVHLGASLGYIQTLLIDGILSHPRLKSERKISLVKAITKVIWIQNDFFAKWRLRDDEAFKIQGKEPQVEEEGYLHGKKVLNLSNDSPIEPDTPISETGSCPFSPLAVRLERASVSEFPFPHPAIPEESHS